LNRISLGFFSKFLSELRTQNNDSSIELLSDDDWMEILFPLRIIPNISSSQALSHPTFSTNLVCEEASKSLVAILGSSKYHHLVAQVEGTLSQKRVERKTDIRGLAVSDPSLFALKRGKKNAKKGGQKSRKEKKRKFGVIEVRDSTFKRKSGKFGNKKMSSKLSKFEDLI